MGEKKLVQPPLGLIPPRDCTLGRLVYIHPETGEEHWVGSGLDALGRELPDPVPFAPPVAMGQQMTLADTIRHMLHQAKLREVMETEGWDTEEEANDFDVEDEPLAPGTTLFEAWADLADRGLVPGGPPPPAPVPEPSSAVPVASGAPPTSPPSPPTPSSSASPAAPPVAPKAP